jgi:hypothetical protein
MHCIVLRCCVPLAPLLAALCFEDGDEGMHATVCGSLHCACDMVPCFGEKVKYLISLLGP